MIRPGGRSTGLQYTSGNPAFVDWSDCCLVTFRRFYSRIFHILFCLNLVVSEWELMFSVQDMVGNRYWSQWWLAGHLIMLPLRIGRSWGLVLGPGLHWIHVGQKTVRVWSVTSIQFSLSSLSSDCIWIVYEDCGIVSIVYPCAILLVCPLWLCCSIVALTTFLNT